MIKKQGDELFIYVVLAFVAVLIVGVILGWLCPIEGPIDYMYDNYASQPAINRPHRGVPAPAPKKVEIFEDFNEDGEPEWYQLIPLFDVKDE